MKILHNKYQLNFRKWSLSLVLFSLFLTVIPMQAENNIPAEKISIEEAFTLIGTEYGVHFNYDRAVVADVEVDYESGQYEKVEDALQSVFSQTHLKYEVFDQRYVAVYRQDREGVESMKKMVSHFQEVISTSEEAYRRTERRVTPPLASLSIKDIYSKRIVFSVSGTVTDQDGEPLIGVNIQVKGSDKGTATDFDGKFSLEDISENAVLVISYVGYQMQEVEVQGRTELEIVMTSDAQLLEEVVVVGYGTQQRVEMTTSVSKVDSRAIENIPLSNAATALEGIIPGLKITTETGLPGSTPNILLRGGTDWDGGSAPLILIDGVPGSFYGVNTEDIASIEVLKDAAATAIYGARAANGVILIATKKGEYGKTQISYKYKLGLNKMRKGYSYMNSEDYLRTNRLAWKDYVEITGRTNFDSYIVNSGVGWTAMGNTENSIYTAQYLNSENEYLLKEGWKVMEDPLYGELIAGHSFDNKYLIFQDNDMSNLFFQNSTINDHYISASGGNDKGSFSLGVGYQDNVGIVIGSGFERFTGSLNSDYKIKDNVKLSTNIYFSRSSQADTYLGSNYWWVFNRAKGQPPTSRIYNSDGSINPGLNISFGNPMYYKDKFKKNNLNQHLSTNVSLEWDINSKLKFTVTGSQMTRSIIDESFDKAYMDAGALNINREASADLNKDENFQYNALLQYYTDFTNKHSLNILLGGEYYTNNYFLLEAGTKGSATDLIPTLNVGSEPIIASTYKGGNRLISGLGRIAYDYDTKYLLNLNFRYDGTSKLFERNRWGFFPGVSLGWNAHLEKFYINSQIQSYFSQLKPRISYGINGNIENLSDFGAFGEYGLSLIYSNRKGYYNSELPLPNLKWESATTLNFGLDIGMLKNKILLTGDYFIRDIKDKLSPYSLPYWTGFSSVTTNIGTLRNKGSEIALNANIIDNPQGLKWDISLNYYRVKNYVKKLPDNDLPNNRQGGTEIFNPETGEVEWVGGLQEGKRVGRDLVISHVQEGIYQDEEMISAHKDRYDSYFFAGLNHNRVPGDVIWKDIDGNDTIDYKDRTILGRTSPKWSGGINTYIYHSGFSLYIKSDFAIGHMIFNGIRTTSMAQGQGSQNGILEVLDAWTPSNSNSNIARFVFTDPNKNHSGFGADRMNSKYWEKASYLALREITLSYDIDSNLLRKYLNSMKVYISGLNLYYLTKYTGLMPEKGGEDNGRYQTPRTFSMGVNIIF